MASSLTLVMEEGAEIDMVADSGERQAAITNSAPAGAEGGELRVRSVRVAREVMSWQSSNPWRGVIPPPSPLLARNRRFRVPCTHRCVLLQIYVTFANVTVIRVQLVSQPRCTVERYTSSVTHSEPTHAQHTSCRAEGGADLCHSHLFAAVRACLALPASTLFVMTVVELLDMLKALVPKIAVNAHRA